MVVSRGRGKEGLVFKEYRVPVREHEKVLEMEGSDGCTVCECT